VILGLSHVFGETRHLSRLVDFWIAKGWRSRLAFTLPVPQEKKTILRGTQATHVSLQYLEHHERRDFPGLEFVSHFPSGDHTLLPPSVSLSLPIDPTFKLRDLDGNSIHATISSVPIVGLDVPSVENAQSLLLSLGFKVSESDRSLLEFRHRLFPLRAVKVRLRLQRAVPEFPAVDGGGWNGMSFLVKDFESTARLLPSLRASQSFSVVNSEVREVAFHSGCGLLLEFLAIRKSAVT
jgi:hypothetical protein